ncbi:MAG TPA: peptide deformylase [Sulfurimonas autotrophica]|uniref:Peptide deformylase n=1 Tax=Sulfurimonas autotrophica TaxID=202747 RepID=A0A7C3BZV2_9BACT|nr:peptide deformylase [Sulfurimonas autotrophica]HFB53974.1 peptide deformylase [Sulfurimonas autotrophica]
MKLNIVEYPDKRLRQKSKEVTAFDENLHKLLDAMHPFMIETNGIGLAAIQVAHPIRALVINLPDEEGEQHPENLLEIINPVIIQKDGETTYQEGCLSVPQFYEDVKRHEHITINYQDREGNTQTLDADGLLAIAIQHEMDHLEGILFIDHLSYARRKKFEKEYKKLQKERKKSK